MNTRLQRVTYPHFIDTYIIEEQTPVCVNSGAIAFRSSQASENGVTVASKWWATNPAQVDAVQNNV